MIRGAVGAIGNLLGSERALRTGSAIYEQHVKVGVQGSGFRLVVVCWSIAGGSEALTQHLQEDARASLK